MSARLARLGADLLSRTLPSIAAGAVTPHEQDHARATLAPPLKKEDGRLDFTQPARAVSARARGVDPWPGATAALEGEVIKLFQPRVVAVTGGAAGAAAARPGRVVGAGAEGLIVACGDGGAVAFGELQLPGRKRLPAGVVLNGRPIPADTLLG
jgi:methionyl-tRNA formyltransferase